MIIDDENAVAADGQGTEPAAAPSENLEQLAPTEQPVAAAQDASAVSAPVDVEQVSTAPAAVPVETSASVASAAPTSAGAAGRADLAGQRAKAAAVVQKHKQAKIQKILDFLASHGRVTNEEVCRVAEVSAATAVRYLDELERAGKIRQVGKTGHAVSYELNR